MDAEGVVVDVELVVPQKVDDVGPGADTPGVLEQVVQNFQFVFGQIGPAALVLNLAAPQVEGRAVPAQHLAPVRCRVRPPQQRGDFGQQDSRIIRFGDEGVTAQHDAVQLIHVAVAAGYKDDRRLRNSPYLAAQRKTAGPGQFDVQQHKMGPIGPELLGRPLEVGDSLGLIPRAGQQNLQLGADGGVIFNDEDLVRHGEPPFWVDFYLL